MGAEAFPPGFSRLRATLRVKNGRGNRDTPAPLTLTPQRQAWEEQVKEEEERRPKEHQGPEERQGPEGHQGPEEQVKEEEQRRAEEHEGREVLRRRPQRFPPPALRRVSPRNQNENSTSMSTTRRRPRGPQRPPSPNAPFAALQLKRWYQWLRA